VITDAQSLDIFSRVSMIAAWCEAVSSAGVQCGQDDCALSQLGWTERL
jgi:hypothetical protein